ncbi:MAG: PhzF family phenazine biosynthesis protein [Sphingomonadaceae bacterium]
MTKLPFFQVDAFAEAPFTGNPAAVMPLEQWLPDETLQAIAMENNLSETAFAVPDADGEADYELRWFTPAVEVALCGHATLASGHVLMTGEHVRFSTRKAGMLEVVRDPGSGPGAGSGRYALSLPAWKPAPRPLPELVAALGAEPVATLWHDKGYALVVVASAGEVLAAAPDMRALARQGDIVAIVSAPGADSDFGTDIVSRVFAPGAGIEEGPVTGSAHSAMASYWTERLGRDRFTAYQASARGGRLDCRLDGERVILVGNCVTVIEGEFSLAPAPSG